MSKVPNPSEPSDSSSGPIALLPLASHQELAELLGPDIYAKLFEQAGHGKALLDSKGRLHKVNQTLSSLLGYSQEELLQHSLPDWLSREQRPLIQTALGQVADQRLGRWQTEKYLLHRQGHALPVKLQIVNLTASPDEPAVLLLEVQALSQEARTEAAWLAERERLGRAAKLAHIAYASWNPATGEGQWNQDAYMLFGQSEAFAPSFEAAIKLFEPVEAEQIGDAVRETMRSHAARICTARLMQPDGTRRTLSFYLEMLTAGQGTQLLSYALDITPFVEQLERLQAANQTLLVQNRQLRDLSELVNDRLSSPLTTLLAISEQQAQTRLGAAARQGLESIQTLSLELHETRHSNHERSPVSIEVACLRVMQMLEAELAEHQALVALDFSAWSLIEYVPFDLENLLYHLLRASLQQLPSDHRQPFSLHSAYDQHARQCLGLNAPARDLRPVFAAPNAPLTPLLALLTDRGGQAGCRHDPLKGSQCLIRL